MLSHCVAAISRTAHVVSVETQLVIATSPTLVFFLPWGSKQIGYELPKPAFLCTFHCNLFRDPLQAPKRNIRTPPPLRAEVNEVQAILSQGGSSTGGSTHDSLTGGQALLDTLVTPPCGRAREGNVDAARFVIWSSIPFWGPVADNGRTFEQMNLYEAIKKRIETIVSLPAFTDELFPQDIASMLKSRLHPQRSD